MSSNAVGTELISKVVGYEIDKGNFSNTTPNLPQSIAIVGEANSSNQLGLTTDPVVVTSAKQAGELFGYGSPIHIAMRILRPNSGSGVGGTPTVVYPQLEAVGATAKSVDISYTGTATANTTHTLFIAGRSTLDGVSYDINIVTGDTPTIIHGKISDAVNAVLGCPMFASDTATEATLTAKWAGLTSQGITVEIETDGSLSGVSFGITEVTTGIGTPSIGASLNMFENNWHTIVLNTYGTVSSIMSALEQFNGIPVSGAPTGRYSGIIMKPFIAITGSVAEDPSSVTDNRQEQVTIAIAPAPLSLGLAMEAAANATYLYAIQAQNNPHLDISGQSYPDMPTPQIIGAMNVYQNRDTIVKKGCSTVQLISGKYQVADFVTTYHPDGETPPQFRYVRSLTQDFNVRYAYLLLEQIHVVDHVIAADDAPVTANKVIKPSLWKQVVSRMLDDLTLRGLITDPEFSKSDLSVNIGTTNPDRLETSFPYKRSGYGRISSTTVQAGFNFNN